MSLGGTARKAPVCPVPANTRVIQVLRGLLEELLMELVPRPAAPPSKNTEDGGAGHPPKLTFPSLPRNPLQAAALGQPCPGIWVGRSWAGTEQGSAGAPRAGRRTPAARIPRWLRLRAAGPGRGKMLGIRVLERRETGANTNNK